MASEVLIGEVYLISTNSLSHEALIVGGSASDDNFFSLTLVQSLLGCVARLEWRQPGEVGVVMRMSRQDEGGVGGGVKGRTGGLDSLGGAGGAEMVRLTIGCACKRSKVN